jgi:hypothetical protein
MHPQAPPRRHISGHRRCRSKCSWRWISRHQRPCCFHCADSFRLSINDDAPSPPSGQRLTSLSTYKIQLRASRRSFSQASPSLWLWLYAATRAQLPSTARSSPSLWLWLSIDSPAPPGFPLLAHSFSLLRALLRTVPTLLFP